MIEDNPKKEVPRYICFHCIEGSTNPDVCTSCGAIIEEYDLESAVLTPPQYGHYKITFNTISKNVILKTLDKVKIDFLQRFTIDIDETGVQIQSHDIAYERLIEALSSETSIPADSLRKTIIFETVSGI